MLNKLINKLKLSKDNSVPCSHEYRKYLIEGFTTGYRCIYCGKIKEEDNNGKK